MVSILRIVADGNDFNDRQGFSEIHSIVLGLTLRDLGEGLMMSSSEVDVRDNTGRTPLQWAAARGDDSTVVTLLSFGADPNNLDNKFNTPLTLASNQNHKVCVRLLLEVGALPDPILPAGIKFGTPLNCAARNAQDPMLLKTLLDFDAKTESARVDGFTPLLHVSRVNSAAHAVLLLDYGANINAKLTSGETPLTTAIQHNNHDVLRLFLTRWRDYNQCPRLKGPNLLEIMAQYADCETMSIMAGSDHILSRNDDTYILVHCTEVVLNGGDNTDKLTLAWEDLLSTFRACGQLRVETIEKSLEAGLQSRDHEFEDSDSSSDSHLYEDASENISQGTVAH